MHVMMTADDHTYCGLSHLRGVACGSMVVPCLASQPSERLPEGSLHPHSPSHAMASFYPQNCDQRCMVLWYLSVGFD